MVLGSLGGIQGKSLGESKKIGKSRVKVEFKLGHSLDPHYQYLKYGKPTEIFRDRDFPKKGKE